MRRAQITVSTVLLALAAFGPPAAHAGPSHAHRGGCEFDARNGAVYVAVEATDLAGGASPATPVSVDCALGVDGGTPATVLTASGTGVAANAGLIPFTAAPSAVVVLCSRVVVGQDSSQDCGTLSEQRVTPQAVADVLDDVGALQGAYPTSWGGLCGLTSTSPPAGGPQTGELDAGPLVLGNGEEGGGGAGGSVTCSVQVDSPYYTGHNVATVSSRGGGDVLVVPPTPVTYAAGDYSTVYVCTQVTISRDRFPMYLDDGTGTWTRDPAAAKCSPTELNTDYPSTTMRAAGNGKAKGHQKVKEPDPTEPVPPPPPPNTPVYPTGSVDMSKDPTGPVTFAFDFSTFTPPFPTWSCTYTVTSVTCTPPPPGPGYFDVCGEVAADATSKSTGTIDGTSGCASGAAATASSTGPVVTAASATASPNTAFSWTCSAGPNGSVLWAIHCAVGV